MGSHDDRQMQIVVVQVKAGVVGGTYCLVFRVVWRKEKTEDERRKISSYACAGRAQSKYGDSSSRVLLYSQDPKRRQTDDGGNPDVV